MRDVFIGPPNFVFMTPGSLIALGPFSERAAYGCLAASGAAVLHYKQLSRRRR
jgi:hypothetical protein